MEFEQAEELIEGLRNKEDWAREFLDKEYTPRLITLAASMLGYGANVRIGAMDVVQSMFGSLCYDLEQIPDTPEELWGLLFFRTFNKAKKKLREAMAQCRDFRLTQHLDPTTEAGQRLAGPTREKGPEMDAELREDAERLSQKVLAALERLRLSDKCPAIYDEIVRCWLKGLKTTEICETVGCAERTVRRAKHEFCAIVRQLSDAE